MSYEEFATTNQNWVYFEEYDYFAQVDENDNATICVCQGCNKNNASKTKQIENYHCVECTCEWCVCSARREFGRYSDRIEYPGWDSLCRGRCESCRERDEGCIIL